MSDLEMGIWNTTRGYKEHYRKASLVPFAMWVLRWILEKDNYGVKNPKVNPVTTIVIIISVTKLNITYLCREVLWV